VEALALATRRSVIFFSIFIATRAVSAAVYYFNFPDAAYYKTSHIRRAQQ